MNRFLVFVVTAFLSLMGLFATSLILAPAANAQTISVGLVGDSITEGFPLDTVSNSAPNAYPNCAVGPTNYPTSATCGTATPTMQGTLQPLLPTATITTTNMGRGGSRMQDWLPANGNGFTTGAVTVFNSASVNTVWIMLGTNDCTTGTATSQASYQADLTTVVNYFLAHVTGLNQVVLNYPPYKNSDADIPAANARLILYQEAMRAVAAANPTHVFIGATATYSWFQNHLTALGDGIHPNLAGYQQLGILWAQGYYDRFYRQRSTPTLVAANRNYLRKNLLAQRGVTVQ